MWEEREVIKDIPLHALMIPGSHNAGAYKIFEVTYQKRIVTSGFVNLYVRVFRRTRLTTSSSGTALIRFELLVNLGAKVKNTG